MKTDNSTIRDLANKNPDLYNYYYKWRNTEESELERDIEDVLYCLGYKLKDNECAGEYNDLKGYLECEIIPLSEHPTATIKEVADLSTGFTGGENGYDQLKAENESLLQRNEMLEVALVEVKDFLHVLPMLRLGNKEGFDQCINIEGVKQLEDLATKALQNNQTVK